MVKNKSNERKEQTNCTLNVDLKNKAEEAGLVFSDCLKYGVEQKLLIKSGDLEPLPLLQTKLTRLVERLSQTSQNMHSLAEQVMWQKKVACEDCRKKFIENWGKQNDS